MALRLVDIIFFFAVLILMILIVTLIYFIKINNETEEKDLEETQEMKIAKELRDSMKNSEPTIKFTDYEKDQEKLIIIAGACQSNYEELIKSGANFASSPKRINIHALDPAIVASSISLSDKGKPIDLIGILDKTIYG